MPVDDLFAVSSCSPPVDYAALSFEALHRTWVREIQAGHLVPPSTWEFVRRSYSETLELVFIAGETQHMLRFDQGEIQIGYLFEDQFMLTGKMLADGTLVDPGELAY